MLTRKKGRIALEQIKEFFALLKRFDMKALFVEPTRNTVTQLFRFLFVGGSAFLIDTALLMLFTSIGEKLFPHLGDLNYYISAVLSFTIALIWNYWWSIKLVFSGETTKASRAAEFTVFAIIAVTGLLWTEGLLYVFFGLLGVSKLWAKVIAAAIVMFWNYGMRKLILYRRPKDEKDNIAKESESAE